MKGTLSCKLFGHKFRASWLELTEAAKKGLENGIIGVLVRHDYIQVSGPVSYCVRCGLSKSELGISTISNQTPKV